MVRDGLMLREEGQRTLVWGSIDFWHPVQQYAFLPVNTHSLHRIAVASHFLAL